MYNLPTGAKAAGLQNNSQQYRKNQYHQVDIYTILPGKTTGGAACLGTINDYANNTGNRTVWRVPNHY